MERTTYVTPECEVARFESVDVITTSIHLPDHIIGKKNSTPEI